MTTSPADFVDKLKKIKENEAKEYVEKVKKLLDSPYTKVKVTDFRCIFYIEITHEHEIHSSVTYEDNCFTEGCKCKRWKASVFYNEYIECHFTFEISYLNPGYMSPFTWTSYWRDLFRSAFDPSADRVLEICPPEIIKKREQEWKKRLKKLEEQEKHQPKKALAHIITIPKKALSDEIGGKTLFLSDGKKNPLALFKLEKQHEKWVTTQAKYIQGCELKIVIPNND